MCIQLVQTLIGGINDDVIDGAIAVYKTFKKFTIDAGLGESGPPFG